MANKIIVTGSRGQLGSELMDLASNHPSFEFVFFSREEFPIEDVSVAQKILSEHQPLYFINSAAYTAVDRAESETEQAMMINGTAVGALASLCKKQGTRFIHVSTDYVFNGLGHAPIKEEDAVDPVNAYGASKLRGEELALRNNPEAVILRTSWVYSSYGKNFVKTMLRLMSEKESIQVVSDQFGSPTYAADLAAAIMQIISSAKWIPGIFHFSNEGEISWFDFAAGIKEATGSDCRVLPITTEQYPTPARRPLYSVLDKTKIRKLYGIRLINWKESLRCCLKKMELI